ncbi:MAG: ABC transporter permease [Oscillospiraceae bacterium]|nr:ABC transporter permease [Oscillospiraceae bacterium]
MENIRLAFQGIWSHKMRSLLTMLGIIIGIASIITIVSTIKGTNEQIKENLIGSGSNVVTVQLYQDDWAYDMSYSPIPAGVRTIDEDAMKTRLENLSLVEQVSFYTSRNWSDFVTTPDSTFSGEVYGVDQDYFNVCGYVIGWGRNFSPADYENHRRVVILDTKAAGVLFGTDDPVGGIVEIKGEPFTVVGVVEQRNSFQPTIQSYQDFYLYADTSAGAVFLPSVCWPMVFRFDEPQSVAVKVEKTDDMTRAGQLVAEELCKSQIIGYSPSGTQTGFAYRSEDLLLQAQQLQELSNSTNVQLIWIASISLLVGGIGVMNIMLVSVTERTAEIGLKKALGATKRRIRRQFLTEASVLTSLGGLMGVGLGIVMAQVVCTYNSLPMAISVPAILISVAFSVVIGLVFGMLPAMKAANLNPIDALRRE